MSRRSIAAAAALRNCRRRGDLVVRGVPHGLHARQFEDLDRFLWQIHDTPGRRSIRQILEDEHLHANSTQ
jgi:hypothetical protein